MNGWLDTPEGQSSRRISVTLLVRRLTSSLIDIARHGTDARRILEAGRGLIKGRLDEW
jgi:hypothetical protein